MDRRQRRTRAAIFDAFEELLGERDYAQITVQDIIDRADVGRTTFYAHFETKDDLLRELCDRLFGHIVEGASNRAHTHSRYSGHGEPTSIFCHLLQHLAEDDEHALALLSNDRSGVFSRAFQESLTGLVREQLAADGPLAGVPRDFLVNHVTSGFVAMVGWWVCRGRPETPEELDRCFRAVNAPGLLRET